MSYKVLQEKALNLAEFFRQIGIQEGDVIGICSENRMESAITIFGALFVGASVIGVSYLYTEREIIYTIQLTQPKMIFASEHCIAKILKSFKKFSFVEKIVQYGDNVFADEILSWKDIFEDKRYMNPEEEYTYAVTDLSRTAVILMSSGTTGLAKGVQITDWNIIATLEHLREFCNEMYKDEDKIVLNALPWSHPNGFITLLFCSVDDHSLVFLPKFEEHHFLNCIEKYKVTYPMITPPMMVFLAKDPLIMEYDLSSLQELHCGGAPVCKELENTVMSRLPHLKGIRQGYGLSETTFMVIWNNTKKIKPGSVGIVTKRTYCKVVNPETGKILGPNQPGELYCKGPQIMKGYIENDAATKEAIDSDGWLQTGDLVYYDEDRFFFIVDRLKEVIKYGANQVAPAELESLLIDHPKIVDAAVIGIPDEIRGQIPMAFVEKEANAEVTAKEIEDYIAENVTDDKKLRGGVKFLNKIPKNATGKILRRQLKDLIENL